MQAMAAVVEQWKAEGISLASPVAEAAVQRVFAKLGATATSDVVALYSETGGMHEMDKELWCLWPLDRIEQECAMETIHHHHPESTVWVEAAPSE